MTATATLAAARDVELAIEGMTCAACAARVEKKLNKLAGVVASVNYATATARVTATVAVSVEDLIAAVERAGYGAVVPARGQPDPADGEEDAASLRRRLIVALVFFVPLTDLSLMLSLLPGLRFTGWQWVLAGCAAPVALRCAWPFHRAALKNARHGSTSMDTLVSFGIVAACGWSVYAIFVLDRGSQGGTLWARLVHGPGGGIYLETAAAVTTFLLAGRLYEARARRLASQSMRDLAATAARDVCLLERDGTERQVPAGTLRRGMRFIVRPGETVCAHRPRHPAGAACQADRAGPGAEGGRPAGGRPDLRLLRSGRYRLCRGHPGRLAAGRLPRRARGQRGTRGADHRLPVRARAGDPGCPGRRLRRRRAQRDLLLWHAGAIEDASEHPVAAAISAAARKEAGPLPLADGFKALPGLGARGTVNGREVLVGRAALLTEHGLTIPADLDRQCREWERAGRTAVLAGCTRSC